MENRRLGIVSKRSKSTRLGSCVDRLVFGVGETIKTVESHRGTRSEPGTIHVTAAELEQATSIADAVRACWPGATSGRVQNKLVWREPVYGFECSTQPDHVSQDGLVVTDLKTCWSLDDDEINRQICKFGYDMAIVATQIGLQGTGICGTGQTSARWCFVRTSYPHSVRFVELVPELARSGAERWSRACAEWNTFLAKNDWPDTGPIMPFDAGQRVTYKQKHDPIKYIQGE